MESSFSRTPAPSKFSPRNLNCPASKSNTRQTERLMLLLMVFNRRSIENPSANRQLIFEKCSLRSDKHPQPGFCALRTVTLFAPPWLDAFFSIIQSVWSKSVTSDELSGCRSICRRRKTIFQQFRQFNGVAFQYTAWYKISCRHKLIMMWCGRGQQPWILNAMKGFRTSEQLCRPQLTHPSTILPKWHKNIATNLTHSTSLSNGNY